MFNLLKLQIPVIHIGILDFTLFPEYPEFYAKYRLKNTSYDYIYNSKFALNMLDLNKIELATDDDKKYKIDYWAKLFKAKTWEELKSMVPVDDYMAEATNTIFQMSADDRVRKICRDREEFWLDFNACMASKDKIIAEKDAQISDNLAEIANQNAEIARLKAEIENLKNMNIK